MLIETFEDFINRLDFNSIIKDPSKFLLEEFNIQLSNIQLIVIFAIVILFFAELAIRNKNKTDQVSETSAIIGHIRQKFYQAETSRLYDEKRWL